MSRGKRKKTTIGLAGMSAGQKQYRAQYRKHLVRQTLGSVIMRGIETTCAKRGEPVPWNELWRQIRGGSRT